MRRRRAGLGRPVVSVRFVFRKFLPPALAVAAGLFASAASAQEIVGHSVNYAVWAEKPREPARAEAQWNVTLAHACDRWSYGSALVYSVDRSYVGKPNVDRNGRSLPVGSSADQYEENVSWGELATGRLLTYRNRFRLNARYLEAQGRVTFNQNTPGRLEGTATGAPVSVTVPAGSLPPVALRRAIIERLSAPGPHEPFKLRSVEVGRFQMALEFQFELVGPSKDPPMEPTPPKEVADKLKNRAWVVKQTAKQLPEHGDLMFLLHENGVISRVQFKREGLDFHADAKELTLFPPPKC